MGLGSATAHFVLGLAWRAGFGGHGALADEPRLNQIQVIGSHNSYHIAPDPGRAGADRGHRPPPGRVARLHAPAARRAILASRHPPGRARRVCRSQGRAVRRPVRPKVLLGLGKEPGPDPDANGQLKKPGLKILHVPDVDFRSTAPTFVDALKQIRAWSQANRAPCPHPDPGRAQGRRDPGLPTRPVHFGREELETVDAEILSVFAKTEILTPDRVRGRFATLPEAIRSQGWPLLDEVRGLVLFALDNEGLVRDRYLEGHSASKDRVMFVTVAPENPAAAWFKINDPIKDFDKIQRLVKEGFLVRTRADADTRQARTGDVTQRDKALTSGAQFISTDYPEPDRRFSDYSVRFPGGKSPGPTP